MKYSLWLCEIALNGQLWCHPGTETNIRARCISILQRALLVRGGMMPMVGYPMQSASFNVSSRVPT